MSKLRLKQFEKKTQQVIPNLKFVNEILVKNILFPNRRNSYIDRKLCDTNKYYTMSFIKPCPLCQPENCTGYDYNFRQQSKSSVCFCFFPNFSYLTVYCEV